MAKKQLPEPSLPSEDRLMETRIDAMMDLRADPPAEAEKPASGEPGAGTDTPTADSELPPLDIFSGASGAPEVPAELLKDAPEAKTAAPEADTEAESAVAPTPADADPYNDAPAPLDLDDTANDAAVDDIEAHETDEPAGDAEATDSRKPVVRRPRRHPVFWFFVAVVAVIAIVAALLLAGGGNLDFPGGHWMQQWFTKLSTKFGG